MAILLSTQATATSCTTSSIFPPFQTFLFMKIPTPYWFFQPHQGTLQQTNLRCQQLKNKSYFLFQMIHLCKCGSCLKRLKCPVRPHRDMGSIPESILFSARNVAEDLFGNTLKCNMQNFIHKWLVVNYNLASITIYVYMYQSIDKSVVNQSVHILNGIM